MRKSEIIKQNIKGSRTILKKEHLPVIKKEWEKHGYDPNYLLSDTDDFYNILEDYHKDKREVNDMLKRSAVDFNTYLFSIEEDQVIYRFLYDQAKAFFCGFYNVKKHDYFSIDEVAEYATWYLENLWVKRKDFFSMSFWLGDSKFTRGVEIFPDSPDSKKGLYNELETQYDMVHDKFQAIMCNIAAFLIAVDVSEYLDEKSVYNASLNKYNVNKFLKYGPHAGEIFDPEIMCYRKAKDFEEYAYHIHTDFWFHDPSKGYKPDAKYKWSQDIPDISEL